MGLTVIGELPAAMAAIPMALLEPVAVVPPRLVEVVHKVPVDQRVQHVPIQVRSALVGQYVVISEVAEGEGGTEVERAMTLVAEVAPVTTVDYWLSMVQGLQQVMGMW